MHANLADLTITASDHDLMDVRGDQFTDNRVASSIVRRDGNGLARFPTDGILRIDGRPGGRCGIPCYIKRLLRAHLASAAMADSRNAAQPKSGASESRRAAPPPIRNSVARTKPDRACLVTSARQPASACCQVKTSGPPVFSKRIACTMRVSSHECCRNLPSAFACLLSARVACIALVVSRATVRVRAQAG